MQDKTGNLIPADEVQDETNDGLFFIVPDVPDFVSPIDGTVVRGRAGIREHCRLHNVVQTAELKGLPPATTAQPWVHTKEQRREIREQLIYHYDNARRDKKL